MRCKNTKNPSLQILEAQLAAEQLATGVTILGLRAPTAAAGIAVNAQLRADETRLRQKTEGDTLDRLLLAIEVEKRRQAEQVEKRRQAGKADVGLVHIDNKPSGSERLGVQTSENANDG